MVGKPGLDIISTTEHCELIIFESGHKPVSVGQQRALYVAVSLHNHFKVFFFI